jgi:hypothetical protein
MLKKDQVFLGKAAQTGFALENGVVDGKIFAHNKIVLGNSYGLLSLVA